MLLCRKHYSLLYRQFVLTESTCASCEAKPKSGTMFSSHSPDPYTIALHLGSEQPIQEDDVLCGSCYKLHLSILNSLDKAPGSDQSLKEDIELWSSLCTEDTTNSINKSVLDAVLTVGSDLLKGKAILLPQVSKIFLDSYTARSGSTVSSQQELELHVHVGNSFPLNGFYISSSSISTHT